MAGRSSLPRDGMPPRAQCMRYIESAGRQCRAKAEPGDAWCRFHGGKAPSHAAKKEERIQDYKDQLMELADSAVDTIMAKLNSKNEAVALRAAMEILDRAGVSTIKKSETTQTTVQKSELDVAIEQLLKDKHPNSEAASAPTPADLSGIKGGYVPGSNVNSHRPAPSYDPDTPHTRGGPGIGLNGSDGDMDEPPF